jgi:catechol 2,3-dioxygenase-like lactoylglutathione lyase family enzyme
MSRYTASTMSVIGLHHAGVHVTNLERSIAFYEAVFELRAINRLALGLEQLAFLVAGRSRVELIAHGTAGRDTGVVDHLAAMREPARMLASATGPVGGGRLPGEDAGPGGQLSRHIGYVPQGRLIPSSRSATTYWSVSRH